MKKMLKENNKKMIVEENDEPGSMSYFQIS